MAPAQTFALFWLSDSVRGLSWDHADKSIFSNSVLRYLLNAFNVRHFSKLCLAVG